MKDSKTTSSDIRYRMMTAEDLPAAHRLSLAVLWPHRLEDWKFVQALGVGIVAEDASGVIGTVMCWVHGSEFASVGMLIVSPDKRSKGIGRELLSRAFQQIGERTAIMHATASGIALCEGLGFRLNGMVHQHQGTAFHVPFVPLGAGERIRPISPRDEPVLATLAGRATGMPRATVIKHLLTVADGVAIDRYGELIGFAMLRKFGHGYVIGPVIAPDIDRAKALISHWAGTYAGAFVRVDVPGVFGLGPWLTDMGLVQVEQTVPVMVRGEPPRPDSAVTQFAILNQTLG
jgi:GNAT superfamily N-acetyltransferase